jgi:hypothetical protein
MATTGILKITRTSQWANGARKIKILIDAADAGTVASGEAATFPLPAGTHEVSAKIDWCRTVPLTIHVASGGTVELDLDCNARGFRALSLLYLLFFAPHDYLYLRVRESAAAASASV